MKNDIYNISLKLRPKVKKMSLEEVKDFGIKLGLEPTFFEPSKFRNKIQRFPINCKVAYLWAEKINNSISIINK